MDATLENFEGILGDRPRAAVPCLHGFARSPYQIGNISESHPRGFDDRSESMGAWMESAVRPRSPRHTTFVVYAGGESTVRFAPGQPGRATCQSTCAYQHLTPKKLHIKPRRMDGSRHANIPARAVRCLVLCAGYHPRRISYSRNRLISNYPRGVTAFHVEPIKNPPG